MSILQLLYENPPPDPLPPGWILRKSSSQPGTFYYYNQETGEAQWEEPNVLLVEQQDVVETTTTQEQEEEQEEEETSPPESIKRPAPPHTAVVAVVEPERTATVSRKRPKLSSSSSSSSAPKEVRVLHILKKHKDSRRPYSWRGTTITRTRDMARDELKEILSILNESQTTDELRATMEEVARTESDCSSAKRGGDLGYFGRKKMQPEFEHAAFGLSVGQVSDLVETSSGIHILLRIG